MAAKEQPKIIDTNTEADFTAALRKSFSSEAGNSYYISYKINQHQSLFKIDLHSTPPAIFYKNLDGRKAIPSEINAIKNVIYEKWPNAKLEDYFFDYYSLNRAQLINASVSGLFLDTSNSLSKEKTFEILEKTNKETFKLQEAKSTALRVTEKLAEAKPQKTSFLNRFFSPKKASVQLPKDSPKNNLKR